jgi:hypothetical protein
MEIIIENRGFKKFKSLLERVDDNFYIYLFIIKFDYRYSKKL